MADVLTLHQQEELEYLQAEFDLTTVYADMAVSAHRTQFDHYDPMLFKTVPGFVIAVASLDQPFKLYSADERTGEPAAPFPIAESYTEHATALYIGFGAAASTYAWYMDAKKQVMFPYDPAYAAEVVQLDTSK